MMGLGPGIQAFTQNYQAGQDREERRRRSQAFEDLHRQQLAISQAGESRASSEYARMGGLRAGLPADLKTMYGGMAPTPGMPDATPYSPMGEGIETPGTPARVPTMAEAMGSPGMAEASGRLMQMGIKAPELVEHGLEKQRKQAGYNAFFEATKKYKTDPATALYAMGQALVQAGESPKDIFGTLEKYTQLDAHDPEAAAAELDSLKPVMEAWAEHRITPERFAQEFVTVSKFKTDKGRLAAQLALPMMARIISEKLPPDGVQFIKDYAERIKNPKADPEAEFLSLSATNPDGAQQALKGGYLPGLKRALKAKEAGAEALAKETPALRAEREAKAALARKRATEPPKEPKPTAAEQKKADQEEAIQQYEDYRGGQGPDLSSAEINVLRKRAQLKELTPFDLELIQLRQQRKSALEAAAGGPQKGAGAPGGPDTTPAPKNQTMEAAQAEAKRLMALHNNDKAKVLKAMKAAGWKVVE